ncbi:MAG: ATP-binding protein [Pseudomonadota bacterium]|nr:ATP-binding protein [Pseudomonadota bacterium]
MPFFSSEQKKTEEGDAAEASIAGALNGKLRSSMIKLCFAGLLAAASVFQILSLVQAVADGTQRVAKISQGLDVLSDVEAQSDGLEALILNAAPRHALADLAEREDAIANHLRLFQRSGAADLAPEHYTALRAQSEVLIDLARTAVFSAAASDDLEALRAGTMQFRQQVHLLQDSQSALTQAGFGGLAAETRSKVFLLILFLAGTLFLLSTVLITGFREMARRHEIERELMQAMAEVDEASKAKSRFLSTITHEIRTPLNAILGFSELLGREPLSPDQKQQVSRLNSAGRTLSRIVDDVLDLSRIEEGGLELRDEDFSPNELFREAIDLVSVHSQTKGLILSSEISANMPRLLRGDPLRLSQVLLNLLNNAIKFTEEGSVTLRVSSRIEDDKQEAKLRIEVQDSGIGIAPEDQQRLFDRFAQIEEGMALQNNGGSGLGLAISQGLVRSMGGDLQVHSTPEEGATFWFYLTLPIVDGRSELPVEVPELSVLNAAAERVMLVDDSADTGDLIRRIMKREGIHVEVVTNPLDALNQVTDYDPDVILCDMQMPELSGVELTRRIRALPAPYCNVPVIAFSATSFSDEIEQMMLAGANAFLAKPFQINDLVAAISGVLADAGERYSARVAEKRDGHSFHELEEMVQLMGKSWVLKFITRLSDRLEASFKGSQSRSERMAMAHRVVAEAGQIGEKDLALAATSLEQALRAGGDTSKQEARFRNEARAFLSRLPLFTLRIG